MGSEVGLDLAPAHITGQLLVPTGLELGFRYFGL